MKSYCNSFLLGLTLLFSVGVSNAQDADNPWAIGVSANAVNLYSAGGDAPQGEFFDEFFNLNDHWNIGFPQITVARYLTDGLTIRATASANEITKWGEFGEVDESVAVDNLKYYGLDGMLSYDLSGLFNTGKFAPFIGVGGGYTWIEEGPYNTFSTAAGTDNLVGAGTVNGTLGFQYWFTDIVGLNVQTTYKHAFEDYLPDHWQHSMGVFVKLGKKKADEPVINDADEDGIPDEYDLCPNDAGKAELGGCPDSDNDGVADVNDLCPNVKGMAAYGGCADSDNDGVADNKDKCPNEYGTDNGCPAKVAPSNLTNTPAAKAFTGKRHVYFSTDSANLDGNAKEVLNSIVDRTDNSTYTIGVKGYADNRGSESYNVGLSERRAEAVKDYLVSKGISASSISVSAEGEASPIASNATNEGRAQNRRAELTINVTPKN